MVQFMNLPAPRMPQNALLDFTGISNAIDSNRRNALLQDENRRQNEELALRKSSIERSEARESKRDARADVEWFGKQASAYQEAVKSGAIKGPQLQAGWDRILARHPNRASLPAEYLDPMTGPALVAAEAGQWRDPREDKLADLKLRAAEADLARANKPDTKYVEVNGRVIEVGGPSGAREIYSAPDPIKELIAKRLGGGQPAAPQPQMQPPTIQPQSFQGGPQGGGLIPINEPAQVPSPEAMPRATPNMVDTPYGQMNREEAQQLGGAMLLDPRYQAAGRALLDSIQAGGGQLSKPAETQLDERTISAASTLGRLQEIRRANNPKFQQILEKFKMAGASWGAALGAKLSPQMQKDLADYAKYRATAFDNFNQILKELSGTAVSVQELQRQKIVQPNPGEGILDGDDPVTFESKLDQVERLQKAAIARMNFMRSRGVQFNKDTAEQFLRLEDVPAAMDRRGAEIEQQLRQQNPNADPMSIEREAMNQVRREFGI